MNFPIVYYLGGRGLFVVGVFVAALLAQAVSSSEGKECEGYDYYFCGYGAVESEVFTFQKKSLAKIYGHEYRIDGQKSRHYYVSLEFHVVVGL